MSNRSLILPFIGLLLLGCISSAQGWAFGWFEPAAEPCARGTYSSNCYPCPVGRYSNETTPTECAECPKNTYAASTGATECVDCPADSSTTGKGSDANTDCVCDDGFNGPAGGPCFEGPAPSVVPCPSGTYSDANGTYVPGVSNCTACPAGSYSDSIGSTECEPCEADTYVAATGSAACQACPGNSSAPAGSDANTDCVCDDGFNGPAGGPCVPAPECPAGTYTESGCHHCTPCSVGHYSNSTHATRCTPCPVDTYAESTGLTECVACPPSTSSPAGSSRFCHCVCSLGYTGPAGGPCVPRAPEASIAPCPAGTWAPNGTYVEGETNCTACPAGTFAGHALGSTECTPCPENHYSALEGSSACQICPPSSTAPAGSDNVTDCVCVAGFTGPAGGPCTGGGSGGEPCPPGTASSTGTYIPGETNCTVCAPGTFAAHHFGSVGCTPCPADHYSDTPGAQACEVCPHDTTAPAGSNSSDACVGSDSGSSSTGGSVPLAVGPFAPSAYLECSSITSKSQCRANSACMALCGYLCEDDEFSCLACVPRVHADAEADPVPTCAENYSTNVRVWFLSSVLPDGFDAVGAKSRQACCRHAA